jgi:uridine kinase
MSLVIAFAGPTGAGKTTLVTALKEHYSSLIPIFHVAQDGFYKVRIIVCMYLPIEVSIVDRTSA